MDSVDPFARTDHGRGRHGLFIALGCACVLQHSCCRRIDEWVATRRTDGAAVAVGRQRHLYAHALAFLCATRAFDSCIDRGRRSVARTRCERLWLSTRDNRSYRICGAGRVVLEASGAAWTISDSDDREVLASTRITVSMVVRVTEVSSGWTRLNRRRRLDRK